jgi:hypothetical protein
MPKEWQHPKRPPTGQYAVQLLVTGDDLGPEHTVWLIESVLSRVSGFIVYVEAIKEVKHANDE